MISTVVALMLVAVFTEFIALPRLRRELSKTSRAKLRACRAVLVIGVILLTASAAWVGLDWWGHDFPHSLGRDLYDPFLLIGAILFANSMWPPTWLNDRIEGLRIFAVAVEDRPDWKESTHGR